MKKPSPKALRFIIPTVIVAVAVIGSGLYINEENKKNVARSTELAETNSSLKETLPADLLSVDEIKTLATQESNGASITKVELEREHGVYIYKIELPNGKILFFDAKTGKKTDKEAARAEGTTSSNNGASDSRPLPVSRQAKLSFGDARTIALKQKPDGVVRKIEFENEHSRLVFSVRFTDDARIDVDASTGEIVRTKPSKVDSDNDNSSRGSRDDDRSRDDSRSGSDDNSNSGKREGF